MSTEDKFITKNKNNMSKLKKAIKESGSLTHEEYMEQEYGKKGTKKRKEADERLEKIRKEQIKKLTKNK